MLRDFSGALPQTDVAKVFLITDVASVFLALGAARDSDVFFKNGCCKDLSHCGCCKDSDVFFKTDAANDSLTPDVANVCLTADVAKMIVPESCTAHALRKGNREALLLQFDKLRIPAATESPFHVSVRPSFFVETVVA